MIAWFLLNCQCNDWLVFQALSTLTILGCDPGWSRVALVNLCEHGSNMIQLSHKCCREIPSTSFNYPMVMTFVVALPIIFAHGFNGAFSDSWPLSQSYQRATVSSWQLGFHHEQSICCARPNNLSLHGIVVRYTNDSGKCSTPASADEILVGLKLLYFHVFISYQTQHKCSNYSNNNARYRMNFESASCQHRPRQRQKSWRFGQAFEYFKEQQRRLSTKSDITSEQVEALQSRYHQWSSIIHYRFVPIYRVPNDPQNEYFIRKP